MKNKIMTITFIIYIFSFSVLGIVIKDKDISFQERRKLSSFPKLNINNEYVTKLEKYVLDHFPWRDSFRSIKANFNYNFIKKLENNDIYLKDNYIFKSGYPTNKQSVTNFINKINNIKTKLTNENNAYLMIIPDKNYYLDSTNFLQVDYNYIYNELAKLDMNLIDIRSIMTLDDYYETDTHWRQEKLDKVVIEMSNIMNFKYEKIEYTKNKYSNFYGVYYGESAINRKPEMLIYLTNDNLLKLNVNYLENKELNSIYNIDKLNGIDSYEVYLDGASSFIEIYNRNSTSNKELIIFRDSFASSISPLLTNYYSKITLIDNRYINSKNYLDFIKFNNQDILFMYSTLLINDSFSLRG